MRISLLWIAAVVVLDLCLVHAEDRDEDGVGTVIGIDLGTTYSRVGVYENGRVHIIANDQGNRNTPSYVAFTYEGKTLIGDAAVNQLTTNPENTIFHTKRMIGRTWDDPTVQKDIKLFPFSLEKKNHKPHVEVGIGNAKKVLAPEQISAMILVKMKETAEAYLGHNVTHAVVTVPAHFNRAQRLATKDAGTIAGLNVMRIINEPSAAAFAYGIDKKEGEKNILVFDLGGGTFDVTLLIIDKGAFEVVATNGDTHLGGEDFDQRVMEHLIKLYEKKTGRDVRGDNGAMQKLRIEVEKAKCVLSSQIETRIEIESFYDGEDFSEVLSRAKFEQLNMDLFQSTLKVIQQVLDDAYLKNDDIDEIVLVGGSTRIPKIQQLVKDAFNGKEPNRDINPEEAVVYGTAVQAGILSGKEGTNHLLLLEVNSHTLGIETVGGVMTKLIPRNTVFPIRKSRMFSTASDKQPTVTIKVFEGEHPMTKDNHLLSKFDLNDIPPTLRGVPQVEVTFQIDEDGFLSVTAEDKGTGNTEIITVTNDQNRLDFPVKVSFMRLSSSANSSSSSLFNAKNELESYVYSLKNQINDKEKLGSKLSEDEKTKISTAIEEAIEWLDSNPDADTEELNAKKKEVEEIVNPIISKLYQQSGGLLSGVARKQNKAPLGEDPEKDEL